MATDPAFAATPDLGMVQISTANTNRDGTGTLGTLYTGGSSGSRVYRIDIVAAGTVTTGVVRLFLYDGTNTRLFREAMVTATTPSTSIPVWAVTLYFPDGLLLPTNSWVIKASTHNAETFNLFAFAGKF